jgi:hypothetical protein
LAGEHEFSQARLLQLLNDRDSTVREGYPMLFAGFHPRSWNGPDALLEIELLQASAAKPSCSRKSGKT